MKQNLRTLCEQKIAVMEWERDKLLTTKYFDNNCNTITNFLLFCHSNASENIQSKSLVAVVQPTLSGKTRMIIEASYLYPIIMISFKYSNTFYFQLVKTLIGKRIVGCFSEALSRHRNIVLKIRLFFLSYMQFMLQFIQDLGKLTWQELTLPEKRAFNALLQNEGNIFVAEMFHQNIEDFKIETLTLANDSIFLNTQKNIKTAHNDLFLKLGRVYFALDECHVPITAIHGVLFHSDYEIHNNEDVYTWSVYEQSIQTTHGRAPIGYPYKKVSNLFDAFRLVVEEYLLEIGQMTIFASTIYSTWKPMNEVHLYSRDEVQFDFYTKLPILTKENIIELMTDYQISEQMRKEKKLDKLIENFVGRPGLLYEWCLSYIWTDTIESLTDVLPQRIMSLFTHVAKSTSILHKLYFIAFFRNFNLDVFKAEEVDEILISGLGYKNESNTITIEGVIQDYIVKNCIIDEQNMQLVMINAAPVNAELAEIAVMYTIFKFKGKELSTLLNSWTPAYSSLTEFIISTENVYFVNDKIEKSDSVIKIFKEEYCWRSIIGSRTGITMSDIIFPCVNKRGGRCLVTVQVKIHARTLTDEELTDAIQSTSVDKMFSGHASLKENFLQVLESWKSTGVTFVRVVISFAGFTKKQAAKVNYFNKVFPSQPIILVCPSSQKYGEQIFGQAVYNRLCQAIVPPHQDINSANKVLKKVDSTWVLFAEAQEQMTQSITSLIEARKPNRKRKQSLQTPISKKRF